jgi:hypothetical protein
MHLFRCSECSLMRCDLAGSTCPECMQRMLTAKASAGITISKVRLGTYLMPQITGVPPTPQTPPPSAPPVLTSGTRAFPYLEQYPLTVAANGIADWLTNSMPFWGSTTKGTMFWDAVYKELRRIGAGGKL